MIDDDESIRELLAWLMKRNAIRAEAFPNAKQLPRRPTAPASPGCLVLDLYMPGMSGLDLQQYLKEAGIEMPVIFLSGRADVPKAVLAVKSGAIDFIEKPFDYRQIVELVRECLRRDAASRAGREEAKAARERLAPLTQREREVLDRVIAGKVNRLIAEEMRDLDQDGRGPPRPHHGEARGRFGRRARPGGCRGRLGFSLIVGRDGDG